MPNPEKPNENQSEKGVFVHNLYMDCLFDEMRQAWTEAMDDLGIAIGHTAAVSADTWPNSLHTFNRTDGELLIMSMQLDVEDIGRCLSFVVNDISHVGSFGERQIDIYDFLVPLRFSSTAYKRTAAKWKSDGHEWDIQDHTGPVIINRFDSVSQILGGDYVPPTVKKIDATTGPIIDVIDETIAAEQLGAWLSMVSEVSYEP